MSEEATPPTLVQKIVAEALGTFVLVFFGCSAILASALATGRPDYVAIALAFGLTVLTMAYAVGHISGGHFNPGVSVGHAVSGRMSWNEAGIYAGVQVAAGIVAGLVLFIVTKLYDLDDALSAVSTTWDPDAGDAVWVGAFLLELIGTFVFVFVVLAVTDKRREGGIPAPIAIGLSLALVHLGLIGFTGTGVNPARSLGVALFGGWEDALQYQWLYILAPLAGAAAAGFVYPLLFGYDRERPVRAPKPAPAQQWDPQQQWPGQPQGQWQQPQAPQQQWQPQPPQAPPAPPQQQWQPQPPQAPPAPPQQQWGQQGGQWPGDEEDGRTQIRPDGGGA
ncbi:MAG TPA: aquaporin [Nocardioides sp.]|jgi:aquaporin Z